MQPHKLCTGVGQFANDSFLFFNTEVSVVHAIFFPDHLQVSEIMSCFSLMDYFRCLNSAWGLRFLSPSGGVVDADPPRDAPTPI